MVSSVTDTTGITQQLAMQQTTQSQPPEPPSFSDIDTNGDGGVDKSEFADMISSSPFAEEASESTDEMFELLDSDGDGVLTETELEEGQSTMAEYLENELGISPPPPPPEMAESESVDSSLIETALSAYEQNSELSTTLAESVLDIVE